MYTYNTIDIKEVVKRDEKKNKLVSLLISCCTIGFIMLVLGLITITIFKANEIELVVATGDNNKETTIKPDTFNETITKTKPSRPQNKTPDIVSANTLSTVNFNPTDIPVDEIGLGISDGFGKGGFGDGIGGGFTTVTTLKGRCNSTERVSRLVKAGGKREYDRSVLKSLRWIKTQQKPDGSFGTRFPVAMTSFALLAYSGHCETVDSPEFGESVKAAIEYLLTVSEKGKGMITTSRDRNLSYEHGIAMYALAEAYSMNKNARKKFRNISPALSKGMPIIIEGQTNGGGWLYSYGSNGTGDLSVSGWNIQALKAAELTGRKFTGLSRAQEKAKRYIKAAEDPDGTDGYFRYRVSDGQKGRLSLTGVGAYSARILGQPSQLEDKSLALINSKNPRQFQPNSAYSWYYHSLAAFQKQGKHWDQYNNTYQTVMADAQQKDGSWPASSGHGQVGQDGTLYSTCLCTLMLEVYYRYLPTGA